VTGPRGDQWTLLQNSTSWDSLRESERIDALHE
jgi:hypothetical protein